MLTYTFYGLFILSCIILIIVILLQPGKADAGALFSSSISSTAFGPRGTQTILAKLTIGAAALFMLVAIALSLPAITGQRSAVQNSTAEETPPPSSPAASPAQGAANTDATQNTTAAPVETAPANSANT